VTSFGFNHFGDQSIFGGLEGRFKELLEFGIFFNAGPLALFQLKPPADYGRHLIRVHTLFLLFFDYNS
jgi:hypothetical protein